MNSPNIFLFRGQAYFVLELFNLVFMLCLQD